MIHQVVIVPYAISTGRILIVRQESHRGNVILRLSSGLATRAEYAEKAARTKIHQDFGLTCVGSILRCFCMTSRKTPTGRFITTYIVLFADENSVPCVRTYQWVTASNLLFSGHPVHPVLRRLLQQPTFRSLIHNHTYNLRPMLLSTVSTASSISTVSTYRLESKVSQ